MEKASQQAFPKRLFRNERRQQSNATPIYCGVAQHLGVVGAQEPRWLDPVISVGDRVAFATPGATSAAKPPDAAVMVPRLTIDAAGLPEILKL